MKRLPTIFTVTNKVWIWPGDSANWYFIYVDGKEKEYVSQNAKTHHNGMVRVQARIGTTTWETSLFPHKREQCYLLAIKKSVRKQEGIMEGDGVTVEVTLIHS